MQQTTASQEIMEQLAALLNEHRESTGESVTSLAIRAGVDRGQLSRFMSGSYPHGPQFEFVARIANAINVKIELSRGE